MINATVLKRVGLFFVLLFCFSSFISKAVIDIALIASVLVGIAYILCFEKDHLKNYRYLYYVLGLLLIGGVLSCLSLRETEGILYFLRRFRLMLILLPLSVFIRTEKELKYLYLATLLSALTSIIYGLVALDGKPIYQYLSGFHKIGRTADMLMTLGLFSVVVLFYPPVKKFKDNLKVNLAILFGSLVCFWAVGMIAIRGTWVGVVAGLFIFGLLFRRSFLVFYIMLIFLGGVFATQVDTPLTNKIVYDVKSIVNVTKDVSNLSRLQLWRVGLDFSEEQFWFGTGAKNTEEPFLAYFDSKSEEYKEKNHLARKFPNDFHNSYLHIFIENGVVFICLFVSLFVYFFYKNMQAFFRAGSEGKKVIAGSVVAISGFFLTQFFHSDLYSYGAAIMYLSLFAGLFYANRERVFDSFI